MASIKKIVGKTKTSYHVRISVSGFKTQCKNFDRYKDAKLWATKREIQLRDGKLDYIILSEKYTLGDAVNRYLAEVIESKSTKKEYIKAQKLQFKWWKEKYGNVKLSNFNSSTVSEAKQKLGGHNYCKRKPATVNRYLAALSHLFTIAVNEWKWVAENPVSKVRKAKEPPGRVRFLTIEEMKRLFEEANKIYTKPIELIVWLAITTGARKNEILTAKIENYDSETGGLAVYETKNHQARRLNITGKAKDLLDKHIIKTDRKKGYIFKHRRANEPIKIDSIFKTIVKRAKIENFRFHDLRHTTASYLAMNKATIADIAEILGHKDLKMAMRYSHLAPAHTHSVVAEMTESITGKMQEAHA